MPTHVPVLLSETLELLSPKPGETALDCTVGLGGHSEAILQLISPDGMLVGLDADEENLREALLRLKPFGEKEHLLHANFQEIPECLPKNIRQFDVILADLGLSSPHIDSPERGFSFRTDCELDMRFDRSHGMTAAMLIASTDRVKLRDLLNAYGEIPLAHRLTDALIERRSTSPVRRSSDLVAVAKDVYGHTAHEHLPQIFQALRIAVNDEMAALESLLREAPKLLKPGGRFAVISYHSLEDRLVKHAMKNLATDVKDVITGGISKKADVEVLTTKPIAPSEKEIAANPRSRSARLRAIRSSLIYTPLP